jgi:Tfp pilus assembly protein FimT
VVAIIGLMVSISYPTLTAGLDGFRLRSAVDQAGAFVQEARVQADRRQQPVQFTADPKANRLTVLTADPAWRDSLDFGDGVRIVEPSQSRSWMLFPATPPPQVRVLLEARSGARKGILINVFNGLAEDWQGPDR